MFISQKVEYPVLLNDKTDKEIYRYSQFNVHDNYFESRVTCTCNSDVAEHKACPPCQLT